MLDANKNSAIYKHVNRDRSLDEEPQKDGGEDVGLVGNIVGYVLLALILCVVAGSFVVRVDENVSVLSSYGIPQVSIVSAKHVLGGDIFYRDRYFFRKDTLIVTEKNSLGEDNITIPFDNISAINVTENLYDYEFKIIYDDGSFFKAKNKFHINTQEGYRRVVAFLNGIKSITIKNEKSLLQSILKKDKPEKVVPVADKPGKK